MSLYTQKTNLEEKHNKRGMSIPKSSNKLSGSKMPMLHKAESTPIQDVNVNKSGAFMNSNKGESKQLVTRKSKYSASVNTDASSSAYKGYKPHHSPAPKLRSNPLKIKKRSESQNSNNSALSDSHLSTPVQEWVNESSEDTGTGCDSQDSDDFDEEEDKIDSLDEQEPMAIQGSRRKVAASANTKKRTPANKLGVLTRQDSIPSMSRHVRRGKKIPFSVRKPTNDTVIFHKCSISGASETIFFDYPKYVGSSKEYTGKIAKFSQSEVGKSNRLVLKIAESTHIYNSIVNSCKNAGFFLTDSGRDWNLLWTGICKDDVLKYINKYQKVNHFPWNYQLGRKDLLWKNVSRLYRKFGDDYNILPKTYIFPNDYRRFVADAKGKDINKNYYIMKPISSSCGKGIKVINASISMPKNLKNYLVSKYVTKPHLIKGYKYDMRIYVLVTSFDPLVIYMYKDGLVRFSTEKFNLKPKNLKKRYIHLTNYSVNKKHETYIQNKNTNATDIDPWNEEQILSKWSYQQLQKKITEMGNDWSQVELEIKDAIIKTIISVEPQVVHQTNMYTKRNNWWFELYGFDVLLDQKLKPWVLEVNTSPSFSSSSPFDKNLKTRLIWDALTLIGIKPYDKTKFKQDQEKQATLRRVKGIGYNKSNDDNFFDIKGASKYSISSTESEMLSEFVEQEHRLGGYERIFPLESNAHYYSQFFERERSNNDLLRKHLWG